ncbi:MAG: beta-mannosidase [Bacteroidetes bacterium MedPE-SWsnd-G2]|nr:MAG: beta-mannosidase [Bacteroidetes bacterium MedPE-SWsnd-G2]
MNRIAILVLALVFVGCSSKPDTPLNLKINSNWTVHEEGDSISYAAEVPGNIYTDLLLNGIIENPLINDNAKDVKWVSEKNWVYESAFNLDSETLNKKHIYLNLEGLDTYASVFLNDSLLIKTNNAFRSFQLDIKKISKTSNVLKVKFQNGSSLEESQKNNLSYTLPGGDRVFTRKAQFQYGWDWGPTLNTIGVWRPVSIIAFNEFKIKRSSVKIVDLNKDKAKLEIVLDKYINQDEELEVEVKINDSLVKVDSFEFLKDQIIIPIEIDQPKLWWPHNIGEPYQYSFAVEVRKNGVVVDSARFRKGLRTAQLVTEKDSLGETFVIKVNDVPVYCKGVNYIPQHSFQNRVTDKDYNRLLDDAVAANMNMLRVWGGGIYEEDTFYELCDEKGIMVWQDFMFACAMYPGDSAFLDNVAAEAKEQVIKRKNNASVVLWCGNNENLEGWNRWGWQASNSNKENEEIRAHYLKVFDSILPIAVEQESDVDYWESSPRYGRGNPEFQFKGDAHDWGVWHDGYPFSRFEEKVPRFMSEFGFQSLPSKEVLMMMTNADSLLFDDKMLKTHQKHSRGFDIMNTYMERDFVIPNNVEDYAYMSQLVQAWGITKGITAHRIAKPYNMGTLYWQFNDCWPAISWSSIDFNGNWKALHYDASRAFDNVLLSSKQVDNALNFYVVNDNLNALKGKFKVEVKSFEGEVLHAENLLIDVGADGSKMVFQLNLDELDVNASQVYIHATFLDKEYIGYLESPKFLELNQLPIQQSVKTIQGGFEITLYSETLQKDVALELGGARFSDNYFDLLPQRAITITVFTDAKDLNQLEIKTFNKFIR